MSQWAEIRHMSLVDQVPKKQIARRLGLDIKTVRRALECDEAPRRKKSAPRSCRLREHRTRIEAWLKKDRKLTAKRIGRLLVPICGPIPARSVRRFVAQVRAGLYPKEAFVHRTHRLGDTMEVDFGESSIELAGQTHKVKFLVATLPASNAYFAWAYRVERLECLLDGIARALAHFGGVPRRLVLDNTSLAVKRVLKGRDREETNDFHAFRGAYALHVDFCAPARGNEKGSVETGVRYVRNLVFRPKPQVATLDELNASILKELDADLDARMVIQGRTARQAAMAEKEHLRPLPVYLPAACRTTARVVNKFGHVRVDRNTYSVPIALAYHNVWAKIYPERIEIVSGDRVVAQHERCYDASCFILNPFHVLPLLEIKHRAIPESTALCSYEFPEIFSQLRVALQDHTRKPDREWVQVLRLVENSSLEKVERAVRTALAQNTPRLESIRLLLRGKGPDGTAIASTSVRRDDLKAIQVAEPDLEAYDRALVREAS